MTAVRPSRPAERAIRLTLIALGLGTALPVLALVAPSTLSTSYGVDDPDPMTLALLQHRGVLQAALGTALVYAALRPAARTPIALAAITTKSAFLLLTATDAQLRGDVTAVTLVFDPLAVILLAPIASREHRLRRAQGSPG